LAFDGRVAAQQLFDRFQQHALRPARRADGAQSALANAIVDRPTRHAEQLRGILHKNRFRHSHVASHTAFRWILRATRRR
jgi:hypothetical protein